MNWVSGTDDSTAGRTAMERANILVVDDDLLVLRSLSEFLRSEGHRVVSAASATEARELIDEGAFHLILCDVSMPGEDGFVVLEHCRQHWPQVPVVMITGYGTIEHAVRAIKSGAYDYITKPIRDDEIRIVVARALQQRRLVLENQALKEQLVGTFGFDSLIYSDPKMQQVVDTVKRLADSQATVLITGESGTGKSLLARAIHAHSSRRDGPFVEVSCGAMPDSLLESELFGHVKGAFSGASSSREGKFRAAHEGTIFLDEISTASISLQTRLLRILESFQFEPVGSNDTLEVDVRVILATNADLGELVRQGSFRQDLYYRINVLPLALPPLRQRRDDIPLLAEHLLRRANEVEGLTVAGFEEAVGQALLAYSWPGNVRELQNVVYRAALLTRSTRIGVADLPERLLAEVGDGVAPEAPPGDGPQALVDHGGLKGAREAWERRLIAQLLVEEGGSRQKVAARLQINRATLFNKMRQYHLE
jgi:DNA-binding NtrC family response regulator